MVTNQIGYIGIGERPVSGIDTQTRPGDFDFITITINTIKDEDNRP